MKILLFTGAGISQESGLNTFRDKGGIWDQYDLNEVCNFFRLHKIKKMPEEREKIFAFYNLLKDKIKEAEPNKAHLEIAQWQKKYGTDNVKIITSNVDDLFEKAGCINVLHVHGTLNKMHCFQCGHEWESDLNHNYRCVKCESRLTKPGVIFFGEKAPNYAIMNNWCNHKNFTQNDYRVVIGSSLNVIDAHTILQKHRNSYSKDSYNILINKDRTDQDHLFDKVLHGKATEEIFKVSEIFNFLKF